MPKLKTHRGIAARFRLTGRGKVVRMYGNRNNFRRKKRKQVRVKYGRTVEAAPATAARVRRMLGNG